MLYDISNNKAILSFKGCVYTVAEHVLLGVITIYVNVFYTNILYIPTGGALLFYWGAMFRKLARKGKGRE